MAQMLSILGPTASGKSALAMALAREVAAEIVSCDSMQLYRGLDVGTAKPTAAERAAVPHHLVDVLDLAEAADVQWWRQAADRAVRDILARARQPLLVGGTGLYARVLLQGLSLQPRDPELRAELSARASAEGHEVLAAELRAADPAAEARTRGNPRRVVRALEIVRLLGGPIPPDRPAPPPYAGPEFVLAPEPQWHRERIATRTREMLAAGWIEETRALLAQGLRQAPTARQALGYPAIMDYLDGRIADRDALAAEIARQTWRYAKRQRTWFRRQHPHATVLPIGSDSTLADLLPALRSAL